MASQPDNENPYRPPASDSYGADPAKTSGVGQYAPCPSCRHGEAKRVGWSWWGGALGPWMFTHVKCAACGTTFNGKTGQSNNTAIGIYLGISVLIALAIFGAAFCAGVG